MHRLSYIVTYQQGSVRHIGCVYSFLLVCHEGKDHLVVAMSPLESVNGTALASHLMYDVSAQCMWPPHESASFLIPAVDILHKCLVIVLCGEQNDGRGTAHIIRYIHKSTPDPHWWSKSTEYSWKSNKLCYLYCLSLHSFFFPYLSNSLLISWGYRNNQARNLCEIIIPQTSVPPTPNYTYLSCCTYSLYTFILHSTIIQIHNKTPQYIPSLCHANQGAMFSDLNVNNKNTMVFSSS